MTSRTPKRAADGLAPVGPAAPGSASPVADPAGTLHPPRGVPAQMSRRPRGRRAAAGMTSPAGEADPEPGNRMPASPARGRPQAPAADVGASPAPAAGLQAIAAAMSEAGLLSNVTSGTRKRPGLCKLYRLTWYHTHNSKHSPSGFPDLVIAGRWVMYRELKRQKENPTKAQREWIAALEAAGADVDVWRPADWYSPRINRELAALAGLKAGAA